MGEPALKLQDLPSPPPFRAAWVVESRVAETSAVSADQAWIIDNHLRAARNYQAYIETLRSSLGDLVDLAERSRISAPVLKRAIDTLLDRERERAAAMLPEIVKLRERQAQVEQRLDGRLADTLRDIADVWDAAVVSELEALREARLRLDIRRAELINAEKGPGKILESGRDAQAYFRTLRR